MASDVQPYTLTVSFSEQTLTTRAARYRIVILEWLVILLVASLYAALTLLNLDPRAP